MTNQEGGRTAYIVHSVDCGVEGLKSKKQKRVGGGSHVWGKKRKKERGKRSRNEMGFQEETVKCDGGKLVNW